MTQHQTQTWQQWIEAIYNTSDKRINYWQPLVDEEAAKADHPKLYADYQAGMSPDEFVYTHLVHYTEYPQAPIAQIDPDDDALPDDEYAEEK